MKVRSIADVMKDCEKILISKLPGNRMVAATWGAFCEARRMYQMAHDVVVSDREDRTEYYVWLKYGEHYASAMVIRKIADALGVSNIEGV